MNSLCKWVTIDEAKAGPGQGVLVQKVISVLSVALLLKFPPAQDGSAEHQIVAVAWTTQSLFGLEKQNADNWMTIPLSQKKLNNGKFFVMVKTSHLVD